MFMNYVLIADGSVNLPVINHTSLLNAEAAPQEVEQELMRVVRTLAKIGYYRFTMYDVRDEHKVMWRYECTTPEPVVKKLFVDVAMPEMSDDRKKLVNRLINDGNVDELRGLWDITDEEIAFIRQYRETPNGDWLNK